METTTRETKQAQREIEAAIGGGGATARLEYLRGELRAERISYGELSELQGMTQYIDPDDVELLEAAGVEEFGEGREQQAREYAAAHADTCILTGADGENDDDCTTHDHESDTPTPSDASTAHTPTPWTLADAHLQNAEFGDESPMITAWEDDGEGGGETVTIALVSNESEDVWDNAAFIVQAVNSHDQLVDAVKLALTTPGMIRGRDALVAALRLAGK